MAPTIEIDGAQFDTLEGFFRHFIERAKTGGWGDNLDAFNDVLRGGFGTPEGGFVFRWNNHHVSQERLGYAETVRQLELRLETCHVLNRTAVAHQLRMAMAGTGPTCFDWLLEIIRDHGPGGSQAEDGVVLELA